MKSLYLYITIICLVMFGGCGKTSQYTPKELSHLNVFTAGNYSQEEDVRAYVKKFDRATNAYFFNKPDLKAPVIQLTIDNRSNENWVLTPEGINLRLKSFDEIQKDVSPSFGRTFGMQMLFGPPIGSVYGFQQFVTKQRIAVDIQQKSFNQAIEIPAGSKRSTLLFIEPRKMSRRLCITLFNADIDKKILDITVVI